MSLDPQALLRDAKWLLDHTDQPPTPLLIAYVEEHCVLAVRDWNVLMNLGDEPATAPRAVRRRFEINALILLHIFGPNPLFSGGSPDDVARYDEKHGGGLCQYEPLKRKIEALRARLAGNGPKE